MINTPSKNDELEPLIQTRQASLEDQEAILQFTLDEAIEAEGRVEEIEVIQKAVQRALEEPEQTAYYFVAFREPEANDQSEDGSLNAISAENPHQELLGHVSVTREWSDWNNAHYVWVTSMYVKPSARGIGVMKQLLEEVDDYARSIGSPEVRIYVHQGNQRGTRAWLREGFSETSYWMGHRQVLPKDSKLS